MSREYAIYRLLEHGPLTFDEVHEIGGWRDRGWTNQVLCRMVRQRTLRRIKRGTYAIR